MSSLDKIFEIESKGGILSIILLPVTIFVAFIIEFLGLIFEK